MPFFSNDNNRIHYEFLTSKSTIANIDTILMIHGAGMDMTSWDMIIPKLIQTFNVVIYDFRGHGESEIGNETFTLELLTDDLRYLIVHLELNNLHIIGHGTGSFIGMHLGQKYPELVQSISAVSMPIFFTLDTAQKLSDYRKSLLAGGDMTPLAKHVIYNITLQPIHSDVVQKLVQAFKKVEVKTYFDLLQGFIEAHKDIYERFKLNKNPVLLMTGDQDPIYPSYLAGLITSYLPNSRYLSIYQSSNCVFIDQPETTAQFIISFIEEVKSGRFVTSLNTEPFFEELHNDLRVAVADGHNKHRKLPLTISCVNGFRIQIGNNEVRDGWNQRFAKEILMYLVFNPTILKDQLCEDIWGKDNLDKSRRNLRVYLSNLRKLIQETPQIRFIIADHTTICLIGDVECDLLTYIQQLNTTYNEQDIKKKVDNCLELFSKINSNFLTFSYADWFIAIREKIENQLTELSLQMTEYHIEYNNLHEAKDSLKVYFMLNPQDDELTPAFSELEQFDQNTLKAFSWKQMLKLE